jgi:hypothetical protein
MKTRSALEICLPLALFVAACALSLPTLLIAVAWMTIGVISLGHRALESFPTDGIRWEWLRGYRGACLLFYTLPGGLGTCGLLSETALIESEGACSQGRNRWSTTRRIQQAACRLASARRIVRTTHVEGGEIDWAETDMSVELSKKGNDCAAYVGTVPTKGKNPATVTVSSRAGTGHPPIRR